MTLLKKTGIFIWNSLSAVGLVSLCAEIAGLYYLSGVYHLSPARLILKAADRYADYRFQGTFKQGFPRILYKTASDIDRIRHRYATDEHYKKTGDAYANGTSACFCKKDVKQGKAAIDRLV